MDKEKLLEWIGKNESWYEYEDGAFSYIDIEELIDYIKEFEE